MHPPLFDESPAAQRTPEAAPAVAPTAAYEPPREPSFWDPSPVETPNPPPHPTPAPEEQPTGRRTRRGKRTVQQTDTKKKAPFRGGRGQLIAVRVFFWLVVAVLLLGGLRNVVVPDEEVAVEDLAAEVASISGTKGYPLAPASSFASRFAVAYLTFDPEDFDARAQALSTFAVEAAGSEYAVDPAAAQRVLSGPIVVDSEIEDSKKAVITVAAYLSTNTWVYLAVPVYAADTTTFVISGAPGFVSAPAMAVAPRNETPPQIDTTLSDTLAVDLFAGFFDAWAKSDTVALARYTTEDPAAGAMVGLDGAVQFGSIEDAKVPEDGGQTREAAVTVAWKNGNATYNQQYRVTIRQGADGKWSIADVRGGVPRQEGTAEARPEPSATDPEADAETGL